MYSRRVRQVCLLTALLFQLHGLLYIYVAYRQHVNKSIMIYYATKQTIARRKARHIKMRRLLRKKRSLWVKNGRTDAWWRNIINGISPADDWKRNFRMSREQFTELCEELILHLVNHQITLHYLLKKSWRHAVLLKRYRVYLDDSEYFWHTPVYRIKDCP